MPLADVVNEVIRLSDAAQAYWSRELPKRHPNYPLVRAGEDSGPPPEEEMRLQHLLSNLSADEVYKLALIMYLGRGDFGTEDLQGSYKELKETFGKPERAVSQMLDKAPLAEYLSDGMEELKRNHFDDVNNLLK